MTIIANQPSSEYLAQDIGPTIIATASVLIILSTLFVGLRYYARHLAQTKFGIEDLIIPFAWLAEIGLCITGISTLWSRFYIEAVTKTKQSWSRRRVPVATRSILPSQIQAGLSNTSKASWLSKSFIHRQ
jgi:hypothetical protein